MTPSFIARRREQDLATEQSRQAHIERIEEALARPPVAAARPAPVAPTNPFLRASADLAEQWEQMLTDLGIARDEATQLRGEVLRLSALADRLAAELDSRTQWYEGEIARLTARGDQAVEENVSRQSRFDLISKALMMVLNQETAAAPLQPVAASPSAPLSVPPPIHVADPQRLGLPPINYRTA